MNESIRDRIAALSDAEASRLLESIAQAHRQDQALCTDPEPRVIHDLAAALPTRDEPSPADGDAARIALSLLADDPRFAGPVAAMVQNPPSQRLALGVVEGTLLAAGLLIALQTHVKFTRNPDGTWSCHVEKKPTSTKLLSPLVKKLMSIIGA